MFCRERAGHATGDWNARHGHYPHTEDKVEKADVLDHAIRAEGGLLLMRIRGTRQGIDL